MPISIPVSRDPLEQRRPATDELTGLPNRLAWNVALAEAIEAAVRSKAPLSVALVELDHFHAYSGAHGRQAGDRLLKAAVSAWRSVLRESDTLARYGGEVFAVALRSCSLDEAREALERVRTMTPENATCSIGVAEWDRREPGAAAVERAAIALDHAKEAGRDMLVLAAAPYGAP